MTKNLATFAAIYSLALVFLDFGARFTAAVVLLIATGFYFLRVLPSDPDF